MKQPKPAHHIDALGLRCPEPVMLLHNALNQIDGGQCVTITGNDPASARDIHKLCHYLHHRIVDEQGSAKHTSSEQYTLTIEKKPRN